VISTLRKQAVQAKDYRNVEASPQPRTPGGLDQGEFKIRPSLAVNTRMIFLDQDRPEDDGWLLPDELALVIHFVLQILKIINIGFISYEVFQVYQ